VPDDVLPLTRQLFPQTQVVDIDCGHWVISERPEKFRDGKCLSPLLDFPVCIGQLTRGNNEAAVKFLTEQPS
jgi:hypothetical protein